MTRPQDHLYPSIHNPLGALRGLSSEWDFQKFQLQLEAEEQEHRLNHELELKRIELEAQRQCEEVQHEHEAREAQHQCEVETEEASLKCEHNLAVLWIQSDAGTPGAQLAPATPPRLKTPVFSLYKDGNDPEVFLSNFESQAHRWKLPKEEFMKHMAALVEGDKFEVLNSLPSESADNYDDFKNAVCSRFRWQVRGPLNLVREEWEGKISFTKTSMVEYVLSFHQKLTDMMKVARDSLAQAQKKQSAWYDEKAHLRTFEQGDKVMVFLPLKTHKLQAAWKGPHVILDRLDNVAYVETRSGKKPKIVHVNMLKPYFK
ncbi:hypothetical protein Y1Q_0014480 [Alligator mississippiensis]|uniref:SCAN box domain-containing protein n=1 Tax=Alligator mississippiensis TaxID=8496 RepID=A0A151PDQ3_ALLMI|nr:hypothetical protein Y1Q_0014480 [Alligator mississippiensis]